MGPGWGKAAVLLREYVEPTLRIDAVEAWPGYVTAQLRCLYDEVHVQDVRAMSDDQLAGYDVVLMSEVIEHMPKDDGLALFDRMPGWVVVSTPAEFFHQGYGLPHTEEHLSLWGAEDFGARLEHDASQLGAVLVRLAPVGAIPVDAEPYRYPLAR